MREVPVYKSKEALFTAWRKALSRAFIETTRVQRTGPLTWEVETITSREPYIVTEWGQKSPLQVQCTCIAAQGHLVCKHAAAVAWCRKQGVGKVSRKGAPAEPPPSSARRALVHAPGPFSEALDFYRELASP